MFVITHTLEDLSPSPNGKYEKEIWRIDSNGYVNASRYESQGSNDDYHEVSRINEKYIEPELVREAYDKLMALITGEHSTEDIPYLRGTKVIISILTEGDAIEMDAGVTNGDVFAEEIFDDLTTPINFMFLDTEDD